MSNIKLDLSKFKHVSSDDKTTTLKHSDGHQLTLAHSKLSPVNQEQLKALAKMSQGQDKKQDKDEAKQDNQARGPQTSPPSSAPMQAFAKGGEAESSDEDTDTPDMDASSPEKVEDSKPDQIQAATSFDPWKDTSPVSNAARVKTYMDNNRQFITAAPGEDPEANLKLQALKAVDEEDQKLKNQAELRQEDTEDSADKNIQKQAEIAKLSTKLGVQPQTATQPQQVPQQTAGAAQPQAATPQANPSIEGEDLKNNMLAQGFNQQNAGIQNEATAKGNLGVAQAAQLQESIKNENILKNTFQQHYNELEAERQAHIADINHGYINPDQYWEGDEYGKGSHSKLAAGIGMLLSGFNPNGNANTGGTAYLHQQIEDNIAKQRATLGAKQSLLEANLKQFGNLKEATDMTRLMLADDVAMRLKKAEALAQTPMQKAIADQAAGKLKMEYAPLQQQMAFRQMLFKLGNDPSGQGTDAVKHAITALNAAGDPRGKEISDHYVDGIGYSPTHTIAPDIRAQLLAHQQMNMQVADLANFVRTHSTMVPGTPEYNVGQQKAIALQSAIRTGELGTVYKAGEQPLLDKMINSNPAGILKTLKTLPQLDELLGANNRKFNLLKQSVGLPVQQAAAPMAAPTRTVVNKATGQRMGLINGKWVPL